MRYDPRSLNKSKNRRRNVRGFWRKTSFLEWETKVAECQGALGDHSGLVTGPASLTCKPVQSHRSCTQKGSMIGLIHCYFPREIILFYFILFYFILFYFILLSFCLLRAAPMAYGSSQARSLIRAVAASLFHSSRQCQILNPLSEAKDQTGNLMVPSRICFCSTTIGSMRNSFKCYLWNHVL